MTKKISAKRAARLKIKLERSLMRIRNIEAAEDRAIERVKTRFRNRIYRAKRAYDIVDNLLQRFYRGE